MSYSCKKLAVRRLFGMIGLMGLDNVDLDQIIDARAGSIFLRCSGHGDGGENGEEEKLDSVVVYRLYNE